MLIRPCSSGSPLKKRLAAGQAKAGAGALQQGRQKQEQVFFSNQKTYSQHLFFNWVMKEAGSL